MRPNSASSGQSWPRIGRLWPDGGANATKVGARSTESRPRFGPILTNARSARSPLEFGQIWATRGSGPMTPFSHRLGNTSHTIGHESNNGWVESTPAASLGSTRGGAPGGRGGERTPRGGICFDLNLAFAWLLRALGASARLVMARAPSMSWPLALRSPHSRLLISRTRRHALQMCAGRHGAPHRILLQMSSKISETIRRILAWPLSKE